MLTAQLKENSYQINVHNVVHARIKASVFVVIQMNFGTIFTRTAQVLVLVCIQECSSVRIFIQFSYSTC